MSTANTLRQVASGVLFLMLLFLGSGCSISDYDMRMEQSQQRIDYLDEQNKYLAPASVGLPVVKNTEGKVIHEALGALDLYFRPPKGISVARPEGEGVSYLLFSYPATGPDSSFDKVYVGGIKCKEKDIDKRKDFKDRILALLRIDDTVQPKTKALGQMIGHPLQFKWYQVTEPEHAYLNFYEDADYVVAIVFFPRAAQLSGADKLIDFSLSSVYVGPSTAVPLSRSRMMAPAAKGYDPPK